MIDISFKNRTGQNPDILSAVIGADSFFYGLFTKGNRQLECGFYRIDSFADQATIDRIKSDLYGTETLVKKIAYSGKPYLHSPQGQNEGITAFFPAFQNKVSDSDLLTDQDVVVDFGMSKDESSFVDTVLGKETTKFHISTVLANYYYPYSSPKMIAFFDQERIHLTFAKDQKFVYYNQFRCTHENDFLYFVMLAYKEMGVDPEVVPLEMSGKVEHDVALVDMIKGYVKNVDFMKSSILEVTDLRFKAKQHFYLDLFATAICV